MTLEERVEFLHQSIESHDRQIGELVDRIREGFERTQLNLDRLTTAMTALTGHVADQARRIEKLEG